MSKAQINQVQKPSCREGFLSAAGFSLLGGVAPAVATLAIPNFMPIYPGAPMVSQAGALTGAAVFYASLYVNRLPVFLQTKEYSSGWRSFSASAVTALSMAMGFNLGLAGAGPIALLLASGTVLFWADRASTEAEVAASLRGDVHKHRLGRKILAGTLAGVSLTIAMNYAAGTYVSEHPLAPIVAAQPVKAPSPA